MRAFAKLLIGAVTAAVFIFQGGCGKAGEEDLAGQEAAFLADESFCEETDSSAADSSAEQICVYVCGAVAKPGVYTLPGGSRVYEAILMAGGLTAEADERAVNQAEVLRDGQQVTVFTRVEAEELQENEALPGNRVNINTAGVSELTRLSGIGESRAKDIIAYREAHGAFEAPEDIMKVSGIKEAVYEKIKDDITVG